MSRRGIRTIGLYGPLALVVVAWAMTRPDRRRAGAALLGGLWNLSALMALNVVAEEAGWWRFGTVGGELAGVPVDLVLGWALLWGVLPALLSGTVPGVAVVAGLLWADLLLMPLGEPVLVLAEGWLAGEALAVATALVPGLVLARLTIGARMLKVRVVMQVVLFSTLVVGVATLAALGDRSLELGHPLVQLALQAVFLLSVPALAAVGELARRGGGTPFPYDPPATLVTTGPYAYVANPMQLSMTLVPRRQRAGGLLGAGGHGRHRHRLRSGHRRLARVGRAWIATARPGVRTAATCVCGAPWCGHGPATPALRRCTWRPAATRAKGSAAGSRRRPVGLEIRSASKAPAPLTRLGYFGPEGHHASGVAAFARALEHLHLGWAMLAWLLLLPVVGRFVQLVVDAAGGGPLAQPVVPDDGSSSRSETVTVTVPVP